MPQSDDTKPVLNINLIDFVIDDSGELRISNPVLADKIKSSLDLLKNKPNEAMKDNYVGCGGNAYQCGKAADGIEGLEGLIKIAQDAKNAKLGK